MTNQTFDRTVERIEDMIFIAEHTKKNSLLQHLHNEAEEILFLANGVIDYITEGFGPKGYDELRKEYQRFVTRLQAA
jgi:hypothetical protein